MGRKTLYFIGGFIVLYLASCILLYLFQEPLLFNSKKLQSDHKFDFNFEYKELTIETVDHIKLNGILCKADTSLGLIFFLHGSGGNIERYKKIFLFILLLTMICSY